MVKQMKTFRIMMNNTLTAKKTILADVYSSQIEVDNAIAKIEAKTKNKKYVTYCKIYNDSRLPKGVAEF